MPSKNNKIKRPNFEETLASMKPDKYHIYYADKSEAAREEFAEALKSTEFAVATFSNGKELLEAAKANIPEMIILDIEFDDMDGIEVCWDLKSNVGLTDSLILFYTDRIEDFTQIAAYEAGADDFLKKPMRTRLLIAKLNALFRRTFEKEELPNPVKKFGNLEIDEEQLLVYKKGVSLKLSKKEIQVLILLTTIPGKVFRRNYILKKIWGDNIIVGDRNIDTHIKKLRKKIGKEHIQTIRGIGYKFQM